MPKDFEDCVKGGGRVRTISGPNKRFGLAAGEFVHVCFNKSGMHRGEKKTSKHKREAVQRGRSK